MQKKFVLRIFLITSFLIFLILIFFKFTNKEQLIKQDTQNNNNYIYLTFVKANINLVNYNLIEISSDFGKYNIDNYDTIFSKNVIITYLDNEIKGEYLDFSLENNLMIISRNVILKNNESSLEADVIEMNIETKDVKIFMYEEDKKINIKSLK